MTLLQECVCLIIEFGAILSMYFTVRHNDLEVKSHERDAIIIRVRIITSTMTSQTLYFADNHFTDSIISPTGHFIDNHFIDNHFTDNHFADN